jgi:uncharacterized protein YqjF (DUF2071 family)
MFQSWQQLLFAHWPVPAAQLRPLVPPELTLEEFRGTAWVAVTPFVLRGLHIRHLPRLPGASDFPEVNLRTYVRVGDVPGVWFFSLDAASRVAVSAARAVYRLPYKNAHMRVRSVDGGIDYRSRRLDGKGMLSARYRPVGASFRPAPGTLEHFLTERYALYVVLRNRTVIRCDIHHPPWDLQPAEATFAQNTLADAEGIHLPDQPPLLHYSARQDTLVWPPRVVG